MVHRGIIEDIQGIFLLSLLYIFGLSNQLFHNCENRKWCFMSKSELIYKEYLNDSINS